MTKFDEFETKPVVPEPEQAPAKVDIGSSFPNALAMAREFKDSCPELFEGSKLIYVAEGGRAHQSRLNEVISGMVEVSSEQWLEMGRLSQFNAECVNKGRK